jgi:non-heme chloroperoxidase
MVKSDKNPGGIPIRRIRQNARRRPGRSFAILEGPEPSFLRIQPSRAKVSEGVRESFWLQGMMCGFPGSYFCIKAFSETDLTEDLKQIDVPHWCCTVTTTK